MQWRTWAALLWVGVFAPACGGSEATTTTTSAEPSEPEGGSSRAEQTEDDVRFRLSFDDGDMAAIVHQDLSYEAHRGASGQLEQTDDGALEDVGEEELTPDGRIVWQSDNSMNDVAIDDQGVMTCGAAQFRFGPNGRLLRDGEPFYGLRAKGLSRQDRRLAMFLTATEIIDWPIGCSEAQEKADRRRAASHSGPRSGRVERNGDPAVVKEGFEEAGLRYVGLPATDSDGKEVALPSEECHPENMPEVCGLGLRMVDLETGERESLPIASYESVQLAAMDNKPLPDRVQDRLAEANARLDEGLTPLDPVVLRRDCKSEQQGCGRSEVTVAGHTIVIDADKMKVTDASGSTITDGPVDPDVGFCPDTGKRTVSGLWHVPAASKLLYRVDCVSTVSSGVLWGWLDL